MVKCIMVTFYQEYLTLSGFGPILPVPAETKRKCVMENVRINCTKNGPYEVLGEVTIVDANGRTVSSIEQKAYYLCRCGGSKTKPFCDGTHSRNHFQSE